jgi:hypothetical protein
MGLLKMWRRVLSKEVLEERALKNKRRNMHRKNEKHKKQAIHLMGQRTHKVPQIRKLMNETEYYYKLFKILLRRARPNGCAYSDHINIKRQKHCMSMIDSRRKLLLKITSA